MKRLIATLLIACCCSLILAACQTEKTTETESSTPSMTTVETSFAFDDRVTEDKELTAKGYPPLPLDLQILFQDAHEMASAFALCHFTTVGVTRTINNTTYDVISDPRFPVYQDLETYLKRLFTDEMVYKQLLVKDSPVQISSDGLACVIQASGTDDASYAGHVFTVDSYTTDRIQLTATVYYSDEGANGNAFFETPAHPDRYTTKDMTFEIVNTELGWRFSKCPYLRG